MPYENINELPKDIRDALPVDAQKIFMSAFNSAYSEYNGDEEAAMKVAWAAVKKKYKKVGDKWVKKSTVNNSITANPHTLIRGVAVSEGEWKTTDGESVVFDSGIINEIANKMKGIKIYADEHLKHQFSNLVGEVTNSWTEDDKVMFDAEIVSPHFSDLIRKYPDTVKFSLGTSYYTSDSSTYADPFELIITEYPVDSSAELKQILNGGNKMDEKEKEIYEAKIKELQSTIEAYELEKKTAIADNILSMQEEMGMEKDDSKVLMSMSVDEVSRYEKTIGKFRETWKKSVVMNGPSDISTKPAEDVGKKEAKTYVELRKEGKDEIDALKGALRGE